MPKTELDGLPVIEVPDTDAITVAVKPDDMQEGDLKRSRTASDCHCAAAAKRHR